jgi:hypothetical protein
VSATSGMTRMLPGNQHRNKGRSDGSGRSSPAAGLTPVRPLALFENIVVHALARKCFDTAGFSSALRCN